MWTRALTRLFISLSLALLIGGCGAHRMAPVDVRGTTTLKPEIEDASAGVVGIATGFTLRGSHAIRIEPFTVAPAEVKDQEDTKLAKDMSAYLHNQLLTKLRAAAVFSRVVDGSVSPPATGSDPIILLKGDITRLTEGSQALRYFVGFGAGAAKAQIETQFVEHPSGEVRLITADRRAAGMGIFGGDGRQFLTDSMDQMAEGLVNLLRHLAGGGQPGRR